MFVNSFIQIMDHAKFQTIVFYPKCQHIEPLLSNVEKSRGLYI